MAVVDGPQPNSDVVEATENRDTNIFATMLEIKKRICVIGASGVVGSHVCQTALRKGYKVNTELSQ